MKPLSKAFVIALLTAALTPLTACAMTLSSGSIQGQVLEEGTNKPIPDAIVVARWQGYLASFAHGQTVCVHVQSTTTDAQGTYRFPAWAKSSNIGVVRNVRPIAIAYKPEYEQLRNQSKRDVVYLRPFTGTRGERLRTIAGSAVACGSAGDSEKNLLPLYRALYEDSRELVVTKEDKYILNNLVFRIEQIELPYEEAQKRHIQRLDSIRHE